MTPTDRLLQHLREQPASPVPRRDITEAAIREALERLRPASAVFALFEAMVEKDTSFALFDLEMYPSVLVRKPWKDGVLGPREVCVAKNGAGDLYLFDVETGRVRFVVHDEDWKVGSTNESFDALLESALWTCVEYIEPDDIDEAAEGYHAKIRLAVEIAGVDALNDDARARLVELGVVPA